MGMMIPMSPIPRLRRTHTPYVIGALVVVSSGSGAVVFDIWMDDVLRNLLRDYIWAIDHVWQLQQLLWG